MDVELSTILALLWRGRVPIAFSVFVMLALSIFYLHVARYSYTAVLRVTPAQSTSLSELGSSGQVGQLASLVGLNMPRSQGARTFLLYEESITSRDVADELSLNADIMRHVFSSEWDEKKSAWREPGGAFHVFAIWVKDILGFPVIPWEQPDGARLQKFIAREVTVDEDTKKPIVTLTFSDRDPKFAEQFLTALSDLSDDLLRKKMLIRSTQYSNYLTVQLSAITDNDVRQAVAQSLAEQKKMMMLAGSDVPFAAEPIGNASAGTQPTSPQPFVVMALGLLVGLLIGATMAILPRTRNMRVARFVPVSLREIWPIRHWMSHVGRNQN